MTQILFQREICIDAPLNHVWQLVASEEGLRQWWGNQISLEAREGGRCEEWRATHAGITHWCGVVTLFAPPHQLMLSLRAQEPERGWPQLTTITIALEDKEGQTHVRVTQRALEATSLIGTEGQRETADQPAMPGWPRAQLDRVPPGSVPLPTQRLPTGHVEPTQLLISREQSDELALSWQRRLATLTAASVQTQEG